jgi:hypothetical protein
MEHDKNNLGGWAIGAAVYNWIVENIAEGSTIVELGSGSGSHELAKRFKVICVEHDTEYVGKYSNIKYIFAPIVDGWYEPQFIDLLPQKYDLLIIDAPPAIIGRSGFLKYADRFFLDCPILIDDTNRLSELELALTIRRKFNKPVSEILTDEDKTAIVLI